MTRKTVDIKLMLTFDPCYSEDQILEMSSGRRRMKIVDVARLEGVSDADFLWLALREEFLTARQLRLLACGFAEHALTRVDEPDPRSVAAIAVARRYAQGDATYEELRAARAAAFYAARVHAHAHGLYLCAAYFPAYAADDNAAAAAYYAAGDADDRQWQVERMIAALSGE